MKNLKIVAILCLVALLCVSMLASCDTSEDLGIRVQYSQNQKEEDTTKERPATSKPTRVDDEEDDEETDETTDSDEDDVDPETTQGIAGDEPDDGGDGTVIIEGTAGLIYGYTDDDSAFELVDATNCNASTIVVANQYMGLPVVGIAADAFNGCDALEHVVLHEGIEYIGERAFWGCVSLQSVELPFAVKAIGPKAFYGCSSLTYAAFGDLDGWYCALNQDDYDGEPMNVSSPETNAVNLTDEGYYGWQWWLHR